MFIFIIIDDITTTIKIEVIMLYAQGKESHHQHCVEINQISDWNIGEHGH